MALTIYAYFNVQQVAGTLDAVAAITNSASFMGALRMVAMISFLAFIASVALGKQKEPLDFFKWFITVALINTVLLVPKADVVVVDRTGTTAPTVRSNIPMGLALFASVTSLTGDYLTRLFETVFAMPDDVSFQRSGLMFGNTVFLDSLRTTPENPTLRKDLTDFVNSCTYYDILEGRISQEELTKADDLWPLLENTSRARLTPSSAAPEGSMACDMAHASIGSRLGAEVTDQLNSRGRFLNPAEPTNAAAGSRFSGQVTSAYSHLTGISKSATEIMRQSMLLGTMRDSNMISSQKLDSSSNAIVANAAAQTEVQTNVNFLAMARVAERAGPAIRNIVEIITYALFPVIVLLMIVAGEAAGTYLKGYVMALVWVQLIPPLYAVLNYVMSSVSSAKLTGIMAGTSASGVTLQNIGDLSQHGISDMAIAGYLTLAIPAIAYAIVKSGEIGGSALFSSVGGVLGSTAGAASHAVASGNFTQGAVSMDNVNANNNSSNKYDAAPTTATGYSRHSDGLGTTTYGAGGQVRHQSLQSSTPFGASLGQKMANSMSSQAAHRAEVSRRSSESATEASTSALVERMAISSAYSSQTGNQGGSDVSTSSRSARAVSEMEQIAKQVNKSLGLHADSSVGRNVVGTVTMGGKLSVGGSIGKAIGGSVGGGSETATANRADAQQKLDAATTFAKNQLQQRGITSDTALSDDFRQSEAYQWARQSRAESVKGEEASLSKAKTFTQSAERARSESLAFSQQAQMVQDKWATMGMDYSNFIVGRLKANGQLDAFNMLSQTDPQRAADMASQYAMELSPGFGPMAPVSADLSSVQQGSTNLAGATLDAPGFNTQMPADRTRSDFAGNRSLVAGHGPRREAIGDTVSPQAASHGDQARAAIGAADLEVVKENAATRERTLSNLDSDMQRPGFGPKPGEPAVPGSSADRQRTRLAEFKEGVPPPTSGGKP